MFTSARPSSMHRGGDRAAPLTPPLSSPIQKGTIDPKRGINGPPSWDLDSLSREVLESSGLLGRWANLNRPLQGRRVLVGDIQVIPAHWRRSG